jgi:hypothetical protein
MSSLPCTPKALGDIRSSRTCRRRRPPSGSRTAGCGTSHSRTHRCWRKHRRGTCLSNTPCHRRTLPSIAYKRPLAETRRPGRPQLRRARQECCCPGRLRPLPPRKTPRGRCPTPRYARRNLAVPGSRTMRLWVDSCEPRRRSYHARSCSMGLRGSPPAPGRLAPLSAASWRGGSPPTARGVSRSRRASPRLPRSPAPFAPRRSPPRPPPRSGRPRARRDSPGAAPCFAR